MELIDRIKLHERAKAQAAPQPPTHRQSRPRKQVVREVPQVVPAPALPASGPDLIALVLQYDDATLVAVQQAIKRRLPTVTKPRAKKQAAPSPLVRECAANPLAAALRAMNCAYCRKRGKCERAGGDKVFGACSSWADLLATATEQDKLLPCENYDPAGLLPGAIPGTSLVPLTPVLYGGGNAPANVAPNQVPPPYAVRWQPLPRRCWYVENSQTGERVRDEQGQVRSFDTAEQAGKLRDNCNARALMGLPV